MPGISSDMSVGWAWFVVAGDGLRVYNVGVGERRAGRVGVEVMVGFGGGLRM